MSIPNPEAKAKQTWDVWPGIHKVVRDYSQKPLEKDVAHHLNIINELMSLHSWDEASKARWITAETNFLSLYVEAGFHATYKFHMLQHIYDQFVDDCAPRYSYCFAEETNNFFMSELAQKVRNGPTLPEEVLLMHELWVSSGCPTVKKLRRARQEGRSTTEIVSSASCAARGTEAPIVL